MKVQRLQCLLTILLVAFTALACTSSPTGRSQMILKSDEDLAAESARQFAEMRASMPLLTDQQTIDYIACVANAIVAVLPDEYRNLPWEMAIFDSDAVNAFAMPGGKIGVMQGILKAAQNQDQLAAVIGHEIAHVTSRHANERASRGGMSSVGVQVVAVLLGGGNSGATYTAYEALNAGASLGIMLPFSRGQESEADLVGLDYMAQAGFDPRESAPLWVNMGNESEAAPAEFLSTHPSSTTRIDALVSRFGETLAMYNVAQESGHNPNCEPE